MLLKAHVDQFTNLGGARMAIELGAISIDHLDAISIDESSLLAASKTIAVVTPAVNFNAGASSFVDARRLIESGVALALTTDFNPGSAPCLSLPLVMAIACRYCHLTPAEALNAVTINAAHAIAMGHRLGSIEVGEEADILITRVDDYRVLAFEFGDNHVRTVIKSGKVVTENE
ncbi:MAG: amidohydrolase family protein [Acidobacteriota bacterium]